MAPRPEISVVIPALDEEALLGHCLQSLNRQDCNFGFEVIVVDNGSADGTAAVAERHGARVLQEERPGVARARAAGFSAARAAIVASTDADTIVPRDWLSRIMWHFERVPDLAGISGTWEYSDGPLTMRALIRTVNRAMPILFLKAPWAWSFSGFNFAVRKHSYETCGGFRFDLPYGEDWNLGVRLRKHGRVIGDCRLKVTTSGKAFVQDPLCVRMACNYFSLVCFGRTYLPPLVRRWAEPTKSRLTQAAPVS